MADKAILYTSWLGGMANGWDPKDQNFRGGFIVDMNFDEQFFKDFVHQARYYGAKRMRLFPYETKGVDKPENMFSPVLWDDVNKRWMLKQYNPKYFEVLDKVVEILTINEIELEYSLNDNCQFHGDGRNHAMAMWQNNDFGVKDYYQNIDLEFEWMDYIWNRYGNKILYEIINEASQKKGYNPQYCGKWLARVADRLIQKGCPEKRISWGACPVGDYVNGEFTIDKEKDLTVQASRYLSEMIDGRTGKKYRDTEPQSQDLIRCAVHNIGIYPDDPEDERSCVQMWGHKEHRAFNASDDGQHKGKSKWNKEEDGSWPRGDYKQTYDTALYILKNCGMFFEKTAIECLPSNTALRAWVDNAKANGEAFKSYFGEYPENWGSPDPIYPDPPECKIGDTKTIICSDGTLIVTDTCVGGKWVPTGNVCPEKPKDCKCVYYLDVHNSWFGILDFMKCIFGKKEKYCKEK